MVSLPFFWGINVLEDNLEDFFYWQITKKSSLEFAEVIKPKAAVAEPIIDKSLKPIRNWKVEEINLEAKSAISVLVDSSTQSSQKETWTDKVLFKKNVDEKLPIASLSKLMTALIVLENYNPSQIIQISEASVKQDEDIGNLKVGDRLKIKELLHSALIESSNDAAYALANDGKIKKDAFVELMNSKAKYLGLKNTHFVNPTGLDPDEPNGSENLSNVRDLVKLARYILKKHPLIFEISSKNSYDVLNPDGSLHHFIARNTNRLLPGNEIPNKIIGCKTGWTPRAQGCLLLIIEAPRHQGYLINVILGSKNRFKERKTLINWLNNAYLW